MNALVRKQLLLRLQKKMISPQAEVLINQFQQAFPTSYLEDTPINMMVKDILRLDRLSDKRVFFIELYYLKEKDEGNTITLHLRLYQYRKAIPLSDILPILENLGLRTLNEHPYEVKLSDTRGWIGDFTVQPIIKKEVDVIKVKPIFQDAFKQVCLQICENDCLNKLVLSAELNAREVSILRAYARFLQQAGFRFSQRYIEQTVAAHPLISKMLVALFKLRFDPKLKIKNSQKLLEKKILKELDHVEVLAEDRIMRQFFHLIKATVRTNYFQLQENKPKEYIAFKLESKLVPELPLPLPLYEIFVYSPRFDGIHLRSARVARGGIRWSDRREDMRAEILGLMKAQKVKNAVIVPSGAKGGFVLKQLTIKNKDTEVVTCYQLFIRALLDLTDNIEVSKVVPPANVVCHDSPDPYLVVAADKGTGSFSDIANQVAKEYGYWLGDAFASGGSMGYNHKQMGITARGAWESIRRHFQEIDVNIDKEDFTVVGIGDMGGDVFGNGMLYTPHIKLIAAFDGQNIFIDPHPDPKKSFKERLRLSKSKKSGWSHYNPKLISNGGGVFSRHSKSVALNSTIAEVLRTEKLVLTPDELICEILKAPCDLLYNGGIGTYVKASTESNDDVSDKANDACRVDANKLRCRIVGEGGNLGFTQLARIEYALQGGRLNTDFIDNSAGVDCSDHEVNIKILLDRAVFEHKISLKQRNELLLKMKENVAALVLKDNYNQALSLSLSAARSHHNTGLYQGFIKELESQGEMDRTVEFLPDDKNIVERKAAKQGLTIPEIAILFAYSKIHIKNEILKSHLPEDPYFVRFLEMEFPSILAKNFFKLMQEHILHREIIATQLSNKIVDEMGVTFVYRIQTETGASAAEIIRAYIISAKIFEATHIQQIIKDLSFKVSTKLQYDLLHHVRHLLNLSVRWFLRANRIQDDITRTIKHFYQPIKELKPIINEVVSGNTKAYLQSLTEDFIRAGIPQETASYIATYRSLYILLNVIAVASEYKFDLFKTAKLFYAVGTFFNLVWFRDYIVGDTREGHWYNLSRLTLRDELDILQKKLTILIMQSNKKEKNVNRLMSEWAAKHPRTISRWEKILEMLLSSTTLDYAMLFIALRELKNRVHVEA